MLGGFFYLSSRSEDCWQSKNPIIASCAISALSRDLFQFNKIPASAGMTVTD